MYLFNPLYYLFTLPALILGFYAQFKVRQAYNRYLRVANHSQIGGLEAAQRLLAANGLQQVEVLGTRGELTDHYDPRKKALFLSQGVAQSPSVAALGIVAHEVGHATQDAEAYAPLKVRSAIVPVVQIGSWLGPILFLLGMLLQTGSVLPVVGLVLFSSTLVFALVTLPVEFDASRRAIAMLQQNGLVSGVEEQGVRQVLSAAALTYVAAAAQALSTILYYVFLLSGRRRR
jgi:Zn-dependent membrane protease YugP